MDRALTDFAAHFGTFLDSMARRIAPGPDGRVAGASVTITLRCKRLRSAGEVRCAETEDASKAMIAIAIYLCCVGIRTR